MMRDATASSPVLAISNPVTGQPIQEVAVCSPEEVRAAVARARAAQPAWAALGPAERGRRLRRWADAMWAERAHLFSLIRQETGKNDAGAYIEAAVIDATVDLYAANAARWLRPRTRRPLFNIEQTTRVHYHAFGVVGFITPWNYPYLNALIDCIPALIAGNAAVLKPSESTPLIALYAVAAMHRAGIPHDVVQVVTGARETGEALVDYVDMIAVTGSTATGRAVAIRAAERLIPASLELGGKDPLIVLNDADVDLAASGALMGAFENAGQTCVSIERAYVEAGIYEPFLDRLLYYAQQLVVGAGDGFEVHMGSLTHARELARTQAQIEDAVERGARVLTGGRPRPDLGPLFFEPTILVDVDHTMAVMREETFGPILPVMRVANADEAVALSNDCAYGLAACVYTRDLRRGEAVAARLHCGDVSINRPQVNFATISAPIGGWKHSGIGRRGGVEGLMRFVQPQTVSTLRGLILQPQLTQADDFTRRAYDVKRVLRRWLPV